MRGWRRAVLGLLSWALAFRLSVRDAQPSCAGTPSPATRDTQPSHKGHPAWSPRDTQPGHKGHSARPLRDNQPGHPGTPSPATQGHPARPLRNTQPGNQGHPTCLLRDTQPNHSGTPSPATQGHPTWPRSVPECSGRTRLPSATLSSDRRGHLCRMGWALCGGREGCLQWPSPHSLPAGPGRCQPVSWEPALCHRDWIPLRALISPQKVRHLPPPSPAHSALEEPPACCSPCWPLPQGAWLTRGRELERCPRGP